MSYANPDRRTYTFDSAAVQFAADGTIGMIRGPRGKAGRLIAIGLNVSTTIAGTNGDAQIEIGITGDTDKYAAWSIGEPVAGVCRWSDDSSQTTSPIIDADIAADTEVLVSVDEDTAGDGAGDGVIQVIIDWAL